MSQRDVFDIEFEGGLLKEWTEMLEIQASLFGKKEIELLIRRGLPVPDGPVMDFGCGTGAYSRVLRGLFPSLKIIGVDINKQFLDVFKNLSAKKLDPLLEIKHWDSKKEDAPITVKNCKAAVLRLVLNPNAEPLNLLTSLKEKLSPGTLIFIIEEDDGLFVMDPEFDAFKRTLKAWGDYGKKAGSNRHIGRLVPRFASKAGLELVSVDYVSHTNIDVGLDKLFDYFIKTLRVINGLSSNIISKNAVDEIQDQFGKFSSLHKDDCLFVYPLIITTARVPF